MRILFDHCTPRPLRRILQGHDVTTAFEKGWADLDNGDLLAAGEFDFDIFIKTDRSIRYQQNLRGRRLAILLIPQQVDLVEHHDEELLAAVNSIHPGEYRELIW